MMTHLKRRALIGLLATGAFAPQLVACAGSGESAGSSDGGGEPTNGGVLRFAQSAFPETLDAAQYPPFQPIPQQQVIDTLLGFDPDTGEIAGWLAKDWEIKDEGRTYVFHLREDVTFSNGEKFTSSSVKNTFDNIIELGDQGHAQQAAAYLLNYEGTDTPDEFTAEVRFSEPKAGFEEATTEKPLGIIADESLAKDWDERGKNGVIGTGPFVISDVVQGQSVSFAVREDYAWPGPGAKHSGRPYLDGLEITVLAEDSVKTGSLLSGDIDVARDIGAASLSQVESTPTATIASQPSGGVPPYLSLNLDIPVLQDEAVRQALQIGINRQELVDTLYTKYEPVATSIVSTEVPGYVDLSELLAFDASAAQEKLEGAGWIAGADGIREKSGAPLTIEVQFTSDADKALSELLQQQLKVLGIDLELTQVTAAQSTENQESGDWEIVYGNLTRPDADVLLNIFHPDFAARAKEGWHPDLDELLEKIATEIDRGARAELFAEAQRDVIEHAYAIPLKEQSQIIGLADTVQGFRFDQAWSYGV
jgi:peptide/nickel transport system substrate-binding protein